MFAKYGRSIYFMLVGEGMMAFILVFTFVTLLTHKVYLGLLLGAIASATDPASTVNVLWEYKSRGALTTTLISIVALDDGLALILYGLVSVFSEAMIAHQSFSFWSSIGTPILEIFECIGIGLAAGFILTKIISRVKENDMKLTFVMAVVALVVGISMYLRLDLILSTMVLGATVSNSIPKLSEKLFEMVKEVTTPLYIFFFVVIGASLDMHVFLKVSVLMIIVAYLVARSIGKMSGAFVGGLLSKARPSVRNYSGLCLFTQGGVAMGLAMSIVNNLSHLGEEGHSVGVIVMSVVAATTFCVQLIGPLCVKYAITKADEAYRNVTEEDIIASCKVKDMMRRDFSLIRENASLDEVFETIKERESYHFPLVNKEGELTGLISLAGLRNTFAEEQLRPFIVAKDVSVPAGKILYEDEPLQSAFDIFAKREIDYLPVVKSRKSKKVVGILEHYPLVEEVNRRLFERQRSLEG